MPDHLIEKFLMHLNQSQSDLDAGMTPKRSRANRDYLLDLFRIANVPLTEVKAGESTRWMKRKESREIE